MISFSIPIYEGTIRLHLDRDECITDWKEIDDDYEEEDLSDWSGLCHEVVTEEDRVYIVGVFDGKASTLAHEISHVCIMVAEYTGWEINDHTREPYCYLMGHLFEEAFSKIGKELS